MLMKADGLELPVAEALEEIPTGHLNGAAKYRRGEKSAFFDQYLISLYFFKYRQSDRMIITL